MNIATVTTTPTVNSSTQNPTQPQQRQTAKELIAANVYIQLYHGNASLLAESLEVVQQTSAVILAALEPPTAESITNSTEAEAIPDAELAKVA